MRSTLIFIVRVQDSTLSKIVHLPEILFLLALMICGIFLYHVCKNIGASRMAGLPAHLNFSLAGGNRASLSVEP